MCSKPNPQDDLPTRSDCASMRHAHPHPPPVPRTADCWHIYYGDVRVGTIARRVGTFDTDPWEWDCGFHPGEHQDGTAASFAEARADFEEAWQVFLAKRTEANFQAWRDEQDWTARKYAMWDAGEKLPTQKPSSLMRCPCGEVFDSHRLDQTVIHVPHHSSAQRADGIRR
jgi:hypothetical protein